MLQLLSIPIAPPSRRTSKPLVDYSRNILLTSHEYLQTIEAKAKKREEVRKETERRKVEAAKWQLEQD